MSINCGSQLNLELLNKFGADAWKYHNAELEAILKMLEERVGENRKEIAEINRKRKLDQVRFDSHWKTHTVQTQAGQQLQAMEEQWIQLVNSNVQVEFACERLQQGSLDSING